VAQQTGWASSPPVSCVANGDRTRILATECGNGHGWLVSARVELEVDGSLREHKHVTVLKLLCEKLVLRVRGHKINVERPL
jgi:hypothetical protein